MATLRRRLLNHALLACLALGLTFPSGQAVLARGSEQAGEAQPSAPTGRFDTVSTPDGFFDAAVYAILQDRQGFMWLGTDNGLARYDGYQLTVYQNNPSDPASLSYNEVHTILEDQNGYLWVGTMSGLDRLDISTGKFNHHFTMSGQSVLSLAEDMEGMLWVGTSFGLARVDPTSPVPVAFNRGSVGDSPARPSGDVISAIYQDRKGDIWLASGAANGIRMGLDRFDRPTATFVHYRHNPADPTSLGSGDARAIFQDRQGAVWVGTDSGLSRLDPASTGFTRYEHDPNDPSSLAAGHVNAVLEDSTGRVWVGTANGLDQLDRSQNRFIHHRHDEADPKSLSGDNILTIYEDRSGVLWFGTTTGLSRYNETASQFVLYHDRPDSPLRLSDAKVQAVAEDWQGTVWVGTASGGLNRLDREAGTVAVYRHDPANPASLSSDGVTALFVDRSHTLWIGTDARWLDQFDPGTGTFVHFWYASAGQPVAMAEDQAGNLWIGTRNGLYCLDPATKSFTHFRSTMEPALSTNLVTSIHVLQDGTVWVGTDGGGINAWDPVTRRFTIYRHSAANPNSLADDSVYAFYEEPDGKAIWIGTRLGLDKVECATLTVTHYSEGDGPLGRAVYGIYPDLTGNLWLATNRGLSRFDPRAGAFINVDAGDGLPTSRIVRNAVGESRRGEILIGSNDGLVTFYLDKVPQNPHPPPVVVTSFSLFNKVVHRDLAPGELIRLSYKQNFLSLEFAALDFTAPDKNQYAYKLDGVDAAWVEAGTRRRADYPNLMPGTYVFHVIGSNNSGIWNEQGTAIPITITPPPWGTWWFRTLALLVLLGIVLGAYEWRVRSVRAHSRELEQQVAVRTVELSTANELLEQEIAERRRTQEALVQERASAAVVAERNRLARDLHDSATQSLYAATLYADTASKLLSSGQVEPASENVLKLRATVKEALGEMRMLIFELHPPILAEQGLAAALEARLEAVEGRAGLQTEFHVEGEARLPADIEEGLYRIAGEALNNVLHHAQARRVAVFLRFKPEATDLEVVDDGAGFDLTGVSKRRGLGLSGMAERARQMKGTLTVDSQPGTGTRVVVLVPRDSTQPEVPA